MPERVTMSNRSRQSAEVILAVFPAKDRTERSVDDMETRVEMRQKPMEIGRNEVKNGEAGRESLRGEETRPRNEASNTGQGLLEAILASENMQRAWKRVRENKGSAGVDGLGIVETGKYLVENWPKIREELLSGEYRPQAVKRVLIPKPGGGERELESRR